MSLTEIYLGRIENGQYIGVSPLEHYQAQRRKWAFEADFWLAMLNAQPPAPVRLLTEYSRRCWHAYLLWSQLSDYIENNL